MAVKGLKYFYGGAYTETTVGDLTTSSAVGGYEIGGIRTLKPSINFNDEKFYENGAVKETDKTFKDGALDVEVGSMTDVVMCNMFGCTTSSDGAVEFKVDDIPPFITVGVVGVKQENNVEKYRAVIYPKTQFVPPSGEYEQKGETVTFKGLPLKASIMKNYEGKYQIEKTFSTESDALEYLKTMTGYTTA